MNFKTLVEETGVTRINQHLTASHWQPPTRLKLNLNLKPSAMERDSEQSVATPHNTRLSGLAHIQQRMKGYDQK